jgi:hypothetical protein
MSDERDLLPVDLSLPQTVEALLPWRLALGEAMNRAMALKAAADERIAEFFGDRTEAVVDGRTYQFDGAKSWEYDEIGLLTLLTKMQADGAITQEDFEAVVELIPQPDRVKFNAAKLRQLVQRRGLTEIDEYRLHKVGPKRLKAIG